jgi:uncharacterized protein (DUF2141 family)
LLASAEEPAAGGTELTVVVVGLASDAGVIRMALFASEHAYDAGEAEDSIRKKKLTIENKTAQHSWSGLGPGHYALRVFHDRDEDGELDSDWMGRPKEPFGFSNDPKLRFGPPSFEETRFELGSEPLTVKVKLQEM